MNDPYKIQFLEAAGDWVCDSFSIDIRYIAKKVGDEYFLLGAHVGLAPLPPTEDLEFCIETDDLYAGQIQRLNQTKVDLLSILQKAAHGQLEVNGRSLTLSTDQPYNYFAELANGGDRWFSDLHLRIVANLNSHSQISHIDSCRIDSALRQSSPPFDGMSDLTHWLALQDSQHSHNSPSINIRILPPADIIFSECRLDENKLHLVLHSHPNFDFNRIGLAVRAVPGIGIAGRKQVSSKIKWRSRIQNDRRKGSASIPLKQADSALVMLMIGNTTVRRQWFLDSAKSSNNRLTAIQLFDKELRMVKQAIFDTNDSARFENGIAALLFLMGFSPAIQLETDAPDIIVTTPSGRMVLLECTTRMADFSSKLGKLVDRKGALTKKLEDSKNLTRVDAVLVCAKPKNQIAIRPDELRVHQIVLITRDELLSAFEQLRFHVDPDKLIDDAIAKIARDNDPFTI